MLSPKASGPVSLTGTQARYAYSVSACLGQLRHQLGGVHNLHELLPKRPRLGGLLRRENTDRLEIEQGVGFTALAGGLLQGDPCDNTGERRQSAQEPGGVFQKPWLAGDGDADQQRKDALGPQQE